MGRTSSRSISICRDRSACGELRDQRYERVGPLLLDLVVDELHRVDRLVDGQCRDRCGDDDQRRVRDDDAVDFGPPPWVSASMNSTPCFSATDPPSQKLSRSAAVDRSRRRPSAGKLWRDAPLRDRGVLVAAPRRTALRAPSRRSRAENARRRRALQPPLSGGQKLISFIRSASAFRAKPQCGITVTAKSKTRNGASR